MSDGKQVVVWMNKTEPTCQNATHYSTTLQCHDFTTIPAKTQHYYTTHYTTLPAKTQHTTLLRYTDCQNATHYSAQQVEWIKGRLPAKTTLLHIALLHESFDTQGENSWLDGTGERPEGILISPHTDFPSMSAPCATYLCSSDIGNSASGILISPEWIFTLVDFVYLYLYLGKQLTTDSAFKWKWNLAVCQYFWWEVPSVH